MDSEHIQLASSNPKKPAGRKKVNETRHPVYRGIRQRNSDRWVCEIREPTQQKRVWLGTYPTAEMAARAHDVGALALRGHTACLNFADSVHLPLPPSNDPKDIRKAAMEAAEAFRRQEVLPRSTNFNENVAAGGGVFSTNEGSSGGALMSPSVGGDFGWDDDVESDAEVALWSY